MHKDPPKTSKIKVLLLPLDLEHASQGTIRSLLADPQTDGKVLDRIAKFHYSKVDLMQLLIRHQNFVKETALFLFKISKDIRGFLLSTRPQWLDHDGRGMVPLQTGTLAQDAAVVTPTSEKEVSVYHRIQVMTVAEKIQFALRADKEARSILFKDSNKQVSLAVLGSPKLTEDEVIMMAQSRNVSDEALRTISKNRQWMKNYSVVIALVNNPKTPVAIAMSLLQQLKANDLAILAKNRGVAEVLRTTANRLIQTRRTKA
jgi:hypothetical protein